MTFTLILILNIVFALALLAGLALLIAHPRKLTPHGPEALVAPPAPTPEARAHRRARRIGHGAPLRVGAALE